MANVIWTPQPRQAALMARFEGRGAVRRCSGRRQIGLRPGRGPAPGGDTALPWAYPPQDLPAAHGADGPQHGDLQTGLQKARFNESKHVWTFPSGAKIFFGSMQYTKDRTNYQGKRYDFIDFDELTQFLWEEYSYLFSRNRPNGPGDPLLHPGAGKPRRRGPRLGEGALHHGGPAHANDLGAVQGPLP